MWIAGRQHGTVKSLQVIQRDTVVKATETTGVIEVIFWYCHLDRVRSIKADLHSGLGQMNKDPPRRLTGDNSMTAHVIREGSYCFSTHNDIFVSQQLNNAHTANSDGYIPCNRHAASRRNLLIPNMDVKVCSFAVLCQYIFASTLEMVAKSIECRVVRIPCRLAEYSRTARGSISKANTTRIDHCTDILNTTSLTHFLVCQYGTTVAFWPITTSTSIKNA
jgi:hypothetical protein